MNKLFSIACLLLTCWTCTAQKGFEKFQTDDDGITLEKFDSTNVDENRYNHNNNIYKVGRKFTFSYLHLDTAGVKLLMTKGPLDNKGRYDWTFERMDKKDPSSVYQVILSVNSGLNPFIQHLPDYNQTIISYDFKMLSGEVWNESEMTGVIENEKNLWMHPPRTDLFKILELNPFPYIKEPLAIGNRWTWKLKFGNHWADKRWLTWEGSNENICHYKITDKVILNTKIGSIECFVVSSYAVSKLGQTKLTSYYSNEFGFVKLDYINIDGSQTKIELEKVE